MDRASIIANAKLKLNYNSTQTDVDFQDDDFVTGLQEVYTHEVNLCTDTAVGDYYKKTTTFSWANSVLTQVIPTEVQGKTIIAMMDITASVLGDNIEFGEYGEYGQVFWADKVTLQWGATGPSGDKTILVQYIEVPELLLNDSAVPALIPTQYHYLLTWALSIYMKELAEEIAPQEWKDKLLEHRNQLYRHLEKGKPMSDPPAIKPIHLTSGGFGS